MFSFILKIRTFFANFKKNKGLYFTTLSTLSIITIILTISYLSTVSTRSAEGVYSTEKIRFLSSVEEKLVSKAEQLLSNASLIAQNSNLKTYIVENNQTEIDDFITSRQELVNSFSTSNYELSLFGADREKLIITDNLDNNEGNITQRSSVLSVSTNNNPIVGLELLGQDVWVRSIVPILENDVQIGSLENRQSIEFILDVLKDEKRKFLFVLNKDFLSKEDFERLEYAELNPNYITIQREIDKGFFDFLSHADFRAFLEEGYIVEDGYYATFRLVDDVEGNPFGMFIVGENLEDSGSVIEALREISRNITIAALGLVVALLIFMI